MTPQILVVTATLGDRPTLQKTISSVHSIGGDNVKHVIIAPKEKLSAIRACCDGITCIPEPEGRKGIYSALNYAFCTYGHDYRYLTFINDDDYWLPDFRRLIDIISMDDTLDLVYGRTAYINGNGIKIGSQTSSGQLHSFISLLRKGVVLFTQQATIIKSTLYFRIGGFDEQYKLVADSKFWAQASLLDIKFRYLNCECAAYMFQNGQLSSDKEIQKREHKELLKEFNHIKANKTGILLFRIVNIPIYLKRFFKYKGFIKSPFTPPLVVKLVLIVFPWKIRRYILNKYLLYDIHPQARIGLSYIYPYFLRMEKGAAIGHLNVAVNLDTMVLKENSIINRQNWITGFSALKPSKHFSHQNNRKSELIVGKESAITKNHHIDCTNSVIVGNFVTIAGYRSQFLTHSIDLNECRQNSKAIYIGDYCFVSTAVKILGGSALPPNSVLGAGAVLNKQFTESGMLYAGVPAIPKKKMDENAKYFKREKGFVY